MIETHFQSITTLLSKRACSVRETSNKRIVLQCCNVWQHSISERNILVKWWWWWRIAINVEKRTVDWSAEERESDAWTKEAVAADLKSEAAAIEAGPYGANGREGFERPQRRIKKLCDCDCLFGIGKSKARRKLWKRNKKWKKRKGPIQRNFLWNSLCTNSLTPIILY